MTLQKSYNLGLYAAKRRITDINIINIGRLLMKRKVVGRVLIYVYLNDGAQIQYDSLDDKSFERR